MEWKLKDLPADRIRRWRGLGDGKVVPRAMPTALIFLPACKGFFLVRKEPVLQEIHGYGIMQSRWLDDGYRGSGVGAL